MMERNLNVCSWIKKSRKVTCELKPKRNTSFNLVLFLTLEKICWRTLKINRLLLNSTISQVKKQYDAHLQFWSFLLQQIVNCYCGLLFVGHGGSEELLNHFLSWENRWVETIDFFCILKWMDRMLIWSSKRI